MSLERCLTGVLVRQQQKDADVRNQGRAAGHQPAVTPMERKIYQKQRKVLKSQDIDLQQKIARDKQRIRSGSGNCLSNPHHALARHEKKLQLHRQRAVAIVGAFPPGV